MSSESLTKDENVTAYVDDVDNSKETEEPNESSSEINVVERFQSYEDLMTTVSEYEENTKSNFVSLECNKNFANKGFCPDFKSRIHWESLFKGLPEMEWSGVPYVIAGRKVLNCHLGKDVSLSKKEKDEAEKKIKQMEDHTFQNTRLIIQDTKKMNCPAKIYMYHIVTFPKFKINHNTEKRKKTASKKIKSQLQKDPNNIIWDHSYVVKFPIISDHENHETSGEEANIREKVDKRVKDKVVELYKGGLRTVSEILKHTDLFVNRELFHNDDPVELTRRRFFPTRKDISNLIGKSRKEGRNSLLDQENLCKLVSQCQSKSPKDKFYCRPNLSTDEKSQNEKFLFCYQSEWQQKLLGKYGGITLLDATYRTTRYALPLFFLCVRTNVCYLVVGTFITQEETSSCIEEALVMFKDWNPKWKPETWMVDFCLEEIKALSKVFQGTTITLCDFHREKAWTEWLRKKDHGVSNRQLEILSMLRSIAHACTMQEHKEALKKLTESDTWKKFDLFRMWFSSKWLPAIQMWAHVFRSKATHMVINTNNGLERQNETLKHSYLHGYKNCTLSELFNVLYSRFFPDGYRKYVQMNVQFSEKYRKYKRELPAFLKNRPREFVLHVLKRWFSNVDKNHITCLNVDQGIFMVQSELDRERMYHVDLGSEYPSCTCMDWVRFILPCKHMCAILRTNPNWQWEKINALYTESPLFNLDNDFLRLGSNPLQTKDTENLQEKQVLTNILKPSKLPPRRRSEITNLKRRCVETLKKTIDCVYLVKDKDFLVQFLEECNKNFETVHSAIPTDHGIPLVESPIKTYRKERVNPLPKRKYGKPKQAGAQRFGVTAEMQKADVRIDVSEPEDQLLEAVSPVDQTDTWLTINGIKLTYKDREEICNGGWLDDNVINVCQYLIAQSHPSYAGLIDTLVLAQHSEKNTVYSDQVLQIHHVGAHWVTSARVNKKVTIYDSLTFSGVPDTLKKQITQLYYPLFVGDNQVLEITFMCCQKQIGTNDCGLFAIANCVALANSFKLSSIKFNQDEMRQHLLKCMENPKIEMFPHSPFKSRAKVKKVHLTLHCLCHLFLPDEDMIQCDSCKIWLHFTCAGVQKHDKRVLAKKKFFCTKCTK